MQRKLMKKLTAFALALAMIIGIVPMNVFAYESETHETFKRTTSTIAPGVTQDVCYAYANDGKQMVYYVATADISRDDVIVQTSYKDQYVNGKFGMEKLTNQMAFADKLYTDPTSDRYISDYYKAVVGVNASFYNMQTGQPSGVTYLDGYAIGESASYAQYFAILKDGTAIVDYTKNMNKDDIWQAVAGSQMLVYDGKDVTANASGSYNTDRHSRTCVGVTADGKVVLMSLDGRQEPFSCGGTMHELAQIMLEAGCVAAINLDGGGSTTFASRPEGENDVKVINRPSDGSERSISSGLIIASTAAPSNVFDRAVLQAEEDYVTPGSTVEVTATGVSPAGTAAQIPENAVWALEDSNLGTIKDGVFTSNGTAGDVVIQLVVDEKVVGSTVIHVVIPDKLVFNQSEIVVPYDKTVSLDITATYGLNEVTLKADDLRFEFSDSTVGSMEGLDFTAGSQGTAGTESTIKATLVHNEAITASANLVLGKGSEIIADFEDGTTQGFKVEHITNYNYMFPNMDVTSATSENGKVRNGKGSLKVVPDFSNSTEGGYMGTGLGVEEDIVIEDALTLGMWIYMPEESEGIRLRACLYNENNTRFTTEFMPIGKASTLNKPGWYYVTFDLSKYPYAKIMAGKVFIEFYVSDRDDLTNYNYNHLDYNSLNTRLCFYIDDVTVDYSSAIDDREAPVFSSVRYSDTAMSDAVELKGQTITSNVLSFGAVVHEDTTKNNYTGLDENTAKAYVDGVEVPCTINGGIMSVSDMSLADGMHTVKFSICDKMGNEAFVTRTLNVQSDSSVPTVKLTAHDETLDKILLGSVYYVDLVATDAEKVKNVEVDLDLNNISRWQLDHMEVADGFEAEYTIDADDNIATVKVNCVDKHNLTGENVLVSMPIRTWELPIAPIEGGTKVGQVFTYATFKKGSETWPIDIDVCVDRGILTLKDDTVSTFAGENVQVDTESYVWDNDTKPEGYAEWDGGHDHRVETAQYYADGATNVSTPVELDDKAATCTEDGYTGRTFCEKCNSVVEWGTVEKATGHSYDFVDGILQCVNGCGNIFTGTHTDGKEYVDGVITSDGWVGESYYKDGEKLKGIHKVKASDVEEEFYYDFGDDGISKGKYTGIFLDGDNYKYAQFGMLSSGWKMIDDKHYYFLPETYEAANGSVTTEDGITFEFKDGLVLDGEWEDFYEYKRYWYGPSYYKNTSKNVPYLVVEIDGDTYLFNSAGSMATGMRVTHESNDFTMICYDCGTDGKAKLYTGVYDNMYFENGIQQKGLKLVGHKGSYYFIKTSNKLAETCTVELTSTLTGLVNADGKLYYANNGEIIKGAAQVGEDIYYFSATKYYAMADGKYYISADLLNGLLPAGTYEIKDAKIVLPKVKNGLVEEEGKLYYYENGVKKKGAVKVEEEIYYFSAKYYALADGKYYISADLLNGLLPAGTYEIKNYKIMIPEVKNGLVDESGKLYYYENGVKKKGAVKVGEEIYYFSAKYYALANGKYYISADLLNGLLPAGTYEIKDYKIVIPKPKNGLVEEGGKLYYYENNTKVKGAVKVGEEIYYFSAKYYALADGKYYISADLLNGLLPVGTYEIKDYKIIIPESKNGLVEEGGKLYYYENNKKVKGAVKVEEEIYYFSAKYYALADGKYYISADLLNGLLPAGTYEIKDYKIVLN